MQTRGKDEAWSLPFEKWEPRRGLIGNIKPFESPNSWSPCNESSFPKTAELLSIELRRKKKEEEGVKPPADGQKVTDHGRKEKTFRVERENINGGRQYGRRGELQAQFA